MWEKIKDWCYWHEGLVTFIFATIVALLIVGGLLQYEKQFYHEEEIMVMEVTDMETWTTTQLISTGKTLVPRKSHHYKLVCGEQEISVDSTVYDSTSVGDRIVIKKDTKYRKSDNAVIKITYEYAGN